MTVVNFGVELQKSWQVLCTRAVQSARHEDGGVRACVHRPAASLLPPRSKGSSSQHSRGDILSALSFPPSASRDGPAGTGPASQRARQPPARTARDKKQGAQPANLGAGARSAAPARVESDRPGRSIWPATTTTATGVRAHGTAPVSGWPGGDADGRGDRGREVKESRKGDDGRADPSRARARRAPAFVAAVRCRACLPAGWTDWTPSILPSAFRTPSRPASEEDWVGASGCRRCFFPQESRARVVRLLVSSGR
jgi:hypothetical protein